MVRGLDRFREHFTGYEDHYVLIGGTAATLTMEDAGLQFRATKDLDILLVVEVLDNSFCDKMWEFIKAGSYEIRQSSEGHPRLYRFQKPEDDSYPYMIELFSRRLNDLTLRDGAKFTPLPIDEALSSLSAILLDDDYYNFVMAGRRQAEQLTWIEADRLIPLKASAWLDLSARAAAGDQVDARDIRKHINDVFRLSQLLTGEQRIPLPENVARQLAEFLARAGQEKIELKSLNIARPDQAEIIARLRLVYGVPE